MVLAFGHKLQTFFILKNTRMIPCKLMYGKKPKSLAVTETSQFMCGGRDKTNNFFASSAAKKKF